jgi:hypothetical protein
MIGENRPDPEPGSAKAPGAPRFASAQPPWSPLSVSVISLLLPAGGAIVTVRNLQRLGQLDASHTRKLTIAVAAVFALGYAGLAAVSVPRANGTVQTDAGVSYIMGIGTAVASYVVQSSSYRAWRVAHPTIRTDSVVRGIGVAVIYYLVTLVAAAVLAPLYLGIATVVSSLSG